MTDEELFLCKECQNPMPIVRITPNCYPVYECGWCHITENTDPKVQELNRKIDYAIAHKKLYWY